MNLVRFDVDGEIRSLIGRRGDLDLTLVKDAIRLSLAPVVPVENFSDQDRDFGSPRIVQ